MTAGGAARSETACTGLVLPDDALLWKMPAFCASPTPFLVPVYWRERCRAIQALRSRHAIDADDSHDIWRDSQVQAWAAAGKSSLLLLRSSFSSTQRVDRFGLELVDYLEAQGQQTAYLLNAVSRDEAAHMLVDLGATGILRQVATQLLQKIRPQSPAEVLAAMVERFQRASGCQDWLGTLAALLECVPDLWLVIDLAALGSQFDDAQSWPSDFQGLLDQLRAKGSSTMLKVALLNCRAVWPASASTHVVSVPATTPLPPLKRALRRQRPREWAPKHHFQPPLHRSLQAESLTLQEPDATALTSDVAAGGLEKDSKKCQDWFAKMKAFQRCVDAFRKAPDETSPRIKVAVLDTGVDLSHPHMAEAMADGRLLHHDFVNEADQISDSDGHGTHCTSILLKHAPNAQVYAGRVFKRSRADKDSPTIVAKAVSHAANVWKVDIISLSLGFECSASDMRSAIRQACASNVLIFAAAANDTTNEVTPIRFPARLDEVICVFASDSFGRPSRFNPPPARHRLNFMLPGEGIEAAWPGGGSRLQDGTSCATPIAAAVAAGVLEFATQHSVAQLECLKHYSGMSKLLQREMADDIGGYIYVKPWKLISTGYVVDTTVAYLSHWINHHCC